MKLKRYHIDMNEFVLHGNDTEWVPADIAQEMYDLLQDCESILLMSPMGNEQRLGKKITELLSRASGEQPKAGEAPTVQLNEDKE